MVYILIYYMHHRNLDIHHHVGAEGRWLPYFPYAFKKSFLSTLFILFANIFRKNNSGFAVFLSQRLKCVMLEAMNERI